MLLKLLFLIICHYCCNFCYCFNVDFHESRNVQVQPFTTRTFKRELNEFFDKASYSFNGFQKIESVPVLFPIDICVLQLEGVKYATALHRNKDHTKHFAVFKMNNGSYEVLAEIATPLATAMDCKSLGSKGYVAIAFNITQPLKDISEGSPIYEIAGDRIRAVQYFVTPNLHSVYLQVTAGIDLFLLQTFTNTRATPNLVCPYFKWSGSTFTRMGAIPCSNAHHVEPFSMEYESYVAVANYANQHGRTSTYSEVYHYSREKKQFVLFQKIKTNGAVDVKHFRVPFNEVNRKHFLVFGNSRSSTAKLRSTESKNLEADSVFYVYDKGQFIPYQRLTFYAVQKFLPVVNPDAEKFLLLVACSHQDIKIYNLNDWKFEESEAQFTEGALGKGVSNMRVYQENDRTYLVIANELMMENATNIFLPIFRQEEHANKLRQEIIEWAKENIQRLSSVNIEQMVKDVEAKYVTLSENKLTLDIKQIRNAEIDNAVTRTLTYPPLRMTPNYWKALEYAQQALDALEASALDTMRSKRQTVETQFSDDFPNYKQVSVDTLVVRRKLNAQKVNKVETSSPNFESLTAKEIIVSNQYKGPENWKGKSRQSDTEIPEEIELPPDGSGQPLDTLNMVDLQLTGKLNGFEWQNLLDFTLKRSGHQFVKSPVSISNLQAETVLVSTDEIKGHNLGKLVPINGGHYVIDQEVQFASPIKAKELHINERLNNLHIFQQKFDVLLKRANHTQVVEGPKIVENVKVLEPITISGQLTGKHLKDISPNKAIHEPLILEGDFHIKGNISIENLLHAKDIVNATTGESVKLKLERSVNLNNVVEDVNIKFQEPLKVNNSRVSFINAEDLQRLVKTNVDEVQVVEGEKNFHASVEVRKGFSEVENLNGVALKDLEERLLLKHNNQTVKVPMHVGRVIAKAVKSPKLKLHGKPLDTYLTRTGNQFINGSLHVQRLKADSMNVENLNTSGRIFNERLSDIYQQKSRSAPSQEIFRKNHKFHGSIYVKNLIMNSTLNGEPVQRIEQQLSQLEGNIKYVGNYKFNQETKTRNLTYYGALNGVTAQELGHCWLRNTKQRQVFLSPQKISHVAATKGVKIRGCLNGNQLEDFYTKTYWINRNEHLASARFENPIALKTSLKSTTLNGLNVPGDLLYTYALEPQFWLGPGFIQRNLQVQGSIWNVSAVNGLNLRALDAYLQGFDAGQTLHVEGAQFVEAPNFKTLNHQDLKMILDRVWLANENVELPQHVEIGDAFFEGLLEFEGLINNMNLQYLKNNYLSRSKSQNVNSEIRFKQKIEFLEPFTAEDMQVIGPIIESQSNITFYFNDFVSQTLKTTGPHEVSGKWEMLEALVQGDLHGVLLNGLNLVNDVLCIDTPMQENVITAPKYLNSAIVKSLYAHPGSTVNDVPVASWILDSVYVYENYTIRGSTSIDSINLYNDLKVQSGIVNGVRFDEHNLLLKDHDQILRGDMIIHNRKDEEGVILTNTIEDLHTKAINSIDLNEFFQGMVRKTQKGAHHIQKHLVFTEPVQVEEYHGGTQEVSRLVSPGKREALTGVNEMEQLKDANWRSLEHALQYWKDNLDDSLSVLDHFELLQTLAVENVSNVIPFHMESGEGTKDDYLLLVLKHATAGEPMLCYRWLEAQGRFAPEPIPSWLSPKSDDFDVMLLLLRATQSPWLLKELKGTDPTSLGLGTAKDLLIAQQQQNVSFSKILGEDCLVVSHPHGIMNLTLHCLKRNPQNGSLRFYKKEIPGVKHFKQIDFLPNSAVALLTDHAVEIRNANSSEWDLVDSLAISHPRQMTSAHINGGRTYLAVLTDAQPQSLKPQSVEIYCSSDGPSSFAHVQSLQIPDAYQIKFTYIAASRDLLLNILTAAQQRSLIVFQYQGVGHFTQILGDSTLPQADNLEYLALHGPKTRAAPHLMALSSRKEVNFVELKFKNL